MSARPRAVVIDVWIMRQTRLSTGMSVGEALHPGEKKEIEEISRPSSRQSPLSSPSHQVRLQWASGRPAYRRAFANIAASEALYATLRMYQCAYVLMSGSLVC